MIASNLKLIFAELMKHTDYLDSDLNDVQLTEINQRNWTGDAPLHLAVQLELLHDIQSLIDYGAEINATGEHNMTALHYAVMKSNIDIINLLLKNNAMVDLKDNDGRTPLDWALTSGNLQIISILRDQTT